MTIDRFFTALYAVALVVAFCSDTAAGTIARGIFTTVIPHWLGIV